MQRHKLIHVQGEKKIIQLQTCKVKLYNNNQDIQKTMLVQVGQICAKWNEWQFQLVIFHFTPPSFTFLHSSKFLFIQQGKLGHFSKALGNYVSNLAHTSFLAVFIKTVHTWTNIIVQMHFPVLHDFQNRTHMTECQVIQDSHHQPQLKHSCFKEIGQG